MQPYVLIFSSYKDCGSSVVSYTCGGEVTEHQKGITPVIENAT